ncbi:MAG: hypothetical protein NTY07_20420 [Bacteroidia bacterium]|nr:hypothetical protein [Bacteroidia bacterium]
MVLKPFSSRSFVLNIAILLLIAQSTVAQYSKRRSGDVSSWEIEFTGGVSKFLTSINPNSDAVYKKFNYWNADFNGAFTLSVTKTISPKFNAQFEFLTTKLSGQWNVNSGYPVPPLAIAQGLSYPNPFKTGVNHLNLLILANLNQIVAPNSANDKWYLFVKGGMGLAFLKEYSSLYPLVQPGNPFKYTVIYGGGLSYTINDKIKLKLGSTWYRVETDRLDGVHILKPGGDYQVDPGFAYNVKERYIYPYVGMTYGFGKANFKAHFIQKNSLRSSWFKPSKKKYKRRR